MVLAHTRPVFHARTPREQRGVLFERPSPARIAAISAVIALHAAAFMLLMLPMTQFAPAPVQDEPPVYPTLRIRPTPLVPIEPPEERPQPRPRNTPRTEVPTPPQPPIVIAEGPDVAPPIAPDVVDEGPIAPIVDTGPVSVERLEYASAPPPPYPPEAARRRIEGTVMLRVLVDVDGKPLEVLVQASSGHRALDEAARKFVLNKWRFRPAMQGDVAVQAIGIVPIKFSVR